MCRKVSNSRRFVRHDSSRRTLELKKGESNEQTNKHIALATILGMFGSLATACADQAGSSTANNAPIVKTEPAKPASDKGDQVVRAATSIL
jgi:hypothetical protein